MPRSNRKGGKIEIVHKFKNGFEEEDVMDLYEDDEQRKQWGKMSRVEEKSRQMEPAVWSHARGARACGLSAYDQRKRVGRHRRKKGSRRVVGQRDG